jgi:soluble lytic murein transglycosylase-like protein
MTSKKLFSAFALMAALCLPIASFTATQASADTQDHGAFKRVASANFNKPVRAVQKFHRTSARKSAVKSRSTKGSSPAITAKVKAHARAAGVPVATALAVVRQESGFRPHVTGSAGEIGLMQLKCATARGIGYKGSCKGLYNPDTNLRIGMRYLRKALNRGSVGYYNAGIHAKRLPKAAKKYAAAVARKKG